MPLRAPYFGSYGGQIHVPDYSGIARAGAIRAQGDAAFGKAIGQGIGDMVEKYRLNKEKREKSEAAAMGKIAYIMKNEPDTLFDVAENSPKFGKSLRQVIENPGEATYKEFDTINATLASWDQTRTAGIARDQNMERQDWARRLAGEREKGERDRLAMLASENKLKAADVGLRGLLLDFQQETQDPRIKDALNILDERDDLFKFRDRTRSLREQADTNRLRAEAMASEKAPLTASVKSALELQQARDALTQQPQQTRIAREQLRVAEQGQDIRGRAFMQRGGAPRAVADLMRDAELAARQKETAVASAELSLENKELYQAKTLAAQLEGILSTTAANNLRALAVAAPSDPTAAQRLTQINALTSGKVIQLDPQWLQDAADVLHGGDIDDQPLLVSFMDYQRLVESDRDDGGRKFAMTGKAEEIKKEIDRLSAPSWSPQQRVMVR